MSEVFEILDKDLLGRIGKLKTRHGTIITPELAPVINPIKNIVPPNEIIKIGFQVLMTNAYIIKRHYNEYAIELGVHRLLGVNTPIMTDSGAYQLMEYREIEVTPLEILKYQEKLGSDIGVILDIPTRYDTPYEIAQEEVKETIRRAREALKARERSDILLIGPVQGGRHYDLVRWSAKELSKLDYEIYGIGGPTQIMEQYKFSELINLIVNAKMNLPIEKPIHLFGAGNPIMLPFAVALGVDLFDSASYALYARDLRYMTPYGVIRVDRLKELPCNCPVCSKYDIESFLKLPKDELIKEIAIHNLYVLREEIRRIRQAIYEGNLWELLEIKARAHPSLLLALRKLVKYSKFIEKYDPVTKPNVRGVFLVSEFTVYRPEVIRYLNRLFKNYSPQKVKLCILLPETQEKPFTRFGPISTLFFLLKDKIEQNLLQLIVYLSPYGILPIELDGLYPLSQYETPWYLTSVEKKFILRVIVKYFRKFRDYYEKVLIHSDKERWGEVFYKKLIARLVEIFGRENVFFLDIEKEPYSPGNVDKLLSLVNKII